jgi:hypothetical protein
MRMIGRTQIENENPSADGCESKFNEVNSISRTCGIKNNYIHMKNLPFSILNPNELYTISCRIVEASMDAFSSNAYVTTLCERIERGNRDLAKGLGRSLNSEFTSVLLDKDQVRDNAFIGLRDYIRAFCHSSDTEKATAATTLAIIFENVGNTVYTMGYAVETAKLNILIGNLSSPLAQQAIATIDATEWFEHLKTGQMEFEKVYKTKVETEAFIDYPLVKDAKEKISRYLRALLSYIETNSDLDAAQYAAPKDIINEIITKIVSTARARNTPMMDAETASENANN